MFHHLGLAVVRDGDDFVVTPPSYRFDLEIEEDLIEEIARIHGYDNIPVVAPRGPITMLPRPEARRDAMSVRRLVAGREYQEGFLRQCRSGSSCQPDCQPDERDALKPDRRAGGQPCDQSQAPDQPGSCFRDWPLL